MNKLHCKRVVGRWPADHLPTTYWLTTYWQPTNHLPTTYQPPTDHLLTTYRPPTDHLPITYWPLTTHPLTTYRPLFYGAACSQLPVCCLRSTSNGMLPIYTVYPCDWLKYSSICLFVCLFVLTDLLPIHCMLQCQLVYRWALPVVINSKLLISLYGQLWAVQYGELTMQQ